MSINKIILLGYVGKDPTIKELSDVKKVANFSMATTAFKNEDSTQKETDWHEIVAFSPLAEIAEKYVRKGSKVFVEGRLRKRSWDTPDRQTRTICEVLATYIEVCK